MFQVYQTTETETPIAKNGQKTVFTQTKTNNRVWRRRQKSILAVAFYYLRFFFRNPRCELRGDLKLSTVQKFSRDSFVFEWQTLQVEPHTQMGSHTHFKWIQRSTVTKMSIHFIMNHPDRQHFIQKYHKNIKLYNIFLPKMLSFLAMNE